MTGQSTKLQKLHQVLLSLGTANVYLQEPETLKMKYPCILYRLDDIYEEHANNNIYLDKERYQVTVIDREPDGTLYKSVKRLPLCRFSRHFRADNLNHYVYSLYY
jgi:hypothetical protein